MSKRLGVAGRMARALQDSPLIPLFIVACLLLGLFSLIVTPREDRPDIEVPTATVLLPWPGAGVARVDNQLARPAANWIRQLADVTEIRSSSTDHAALLIVEFEPGTAKTDAFTKLTEVFRVQADEMPRGAAMPRIETYGQERLVVLLATLSSKTHFPMELEQLASEVSARLQTIQGVRGITRHGGDREAIEVLPRIEAMAAHDISLLQVAKSLEGAGRQLPAGMLEREPVAAVQTGVDIGSLAKLARIPVGQSPAGPVYLESVADIRMGTVQRNQAVLNWQRGQSVAYPAVTLAVTTLSGSNVADVTRRIQTRIVDLKQEIIPSGVQFEVRYDAGREATQRVYDVLRQLLTAILIVVGIIVLGLGWRAAVIIALMMPVSLAIVPFIYYQFGFTLNPISIAAMILSIGILSDDAVVMLENVSRKYKQAGKKNRELTVAGVDEVGNPTILADLLVVATLLPTAYISGEMGQYVRALPVGACVAVLFSLVVALTITPYFGRRLLKVKDETARKENHNNASPEASPSNQGYARCYRTLMRPLMRRSLLRWSLYGGLLVLLLASLSLVVFRQVQVGLTPLLDRQVFALQVDLPAGSTLTETLAATSYVSQQLRALPEVASLTLYAGTRAPLIYPPAGTQIPQPVPPHQAWLHVELVPESERQRLSYEVSREVAHQLDAWLAPYDASGYVGRIPSGPTSDRAITAEIYGPDAVSRQALADRVEQVLRAQSGVVATEQFPNPPLPLLSLQVDPRRAATQGVLPAEITQTLLLAVKGRTVTDWPHTVARESIPVILRLDPSHRDHPEALESIHVPSSSGRAVPLQELVTFQSQPGQSVRYRRDMLPLITVVADLDRSVAQPLTVQIAARRELLAQSEDEDIVIRWLSPPDRITQPKLYWSGEWEMTRDVYRDLGGAGAVVLLLIYVLLAGWFRSYTLPFLIMLPVPLIFIGVIPAHWLWGINLAGTGVMGMIALAGIVARNAILLIDLIQRKEQDGVELHDAVIEAGILRTRPILLTAATVLFGSGVLIFEPALKPLGLSLASGVFISTLLTLILIPLLYFHVHKKG